jgi:hypothetical protein
MSVERQESLRRLHARIRDQLECVMEADNPTVSSPTAAFRLLNLPAELIRNIADIMVLTDLKAALRCRTLCRKLPLTNPCLKPIS